MATPDDVLDALAAAMEQAVPELTTALSREADETDNTVRFPHGDMQIISNIRADQWNTDVTGYATDANGNRVGYLVDAKFDIEVQLNIWIAVPSDDWSITTLGKKLERGLRVHDISHPIVEPLPDGEGGTANDINRFRLIGGGELPTESGGNSPLRGYQVTANLRFTDRIDTSVEQGESDYVASVDTPHSGDLTAGDADDIEIEYNAT